MRPAHAAPSADDGTTAGAAPRHAGGEDDLVKLDPDHPGFRDPAYRARRNAIARQALEFREGTPVPAVAYSDDELGVWQTVWRNLAPLHERYACRAYRECAEVVALDRIRVPQIEDVNRVLERTTGFRMLPVAGLVSDRTFLGYLDRSVFLATQYMRHPSRPLYTPEPDVIHELIGHAATFCHPEFVRINRAFGEAAARVDPPTLARIARLYWYTMEFGVVAEAGAIKVCGAGLFSSFGELGRFESQAELRSFDLEEIAASPYDPTNYQSKLYVAPSFDAMATDLVAWLERA